MLLDFTVSKSTATTHVSNVLRAGPKNHPPPPGIEAREQNRWFLYARRGASTCARFALGSTWCRLRPFSTPPPCIWFLLCNLDMKCCVDVPTQVSTLHGRWLPQCRLSSMKIGAPVLPSFPDITGLFLLKGAQARRYFFSLPAVAWGVAAAPTGTLLLSGLCPPTNCLSPHAGDYAQ